jgi:putative ABC transport system ATP-binding protein
VLQLNDVRLVYNPGTPTEVVALQRLSLTFPTGQFVTVVGSNGAGKSSLIQIISGAVGPTEGRIRIGDRDVTRMPDHRRAALVARVFDNPHVGTVPELSIEDNLALAMARGRRRGLRPAVTGRHRNVMRERLALLGLGLERRLSGPVRLLSAGQRQSLTMIMAALTTPEVLLLDEHLAALDPGTQRRVLKLTTDIVAELGCTALMVTHNMEHAIAIGERLLVMSRGRVVADLAGNAKTALTVDDLIAHIVHSGDTVSDRLVLHERP